MPEEIHTEAPVTITVDLDAVLRQNLPTGSWDYDEDRPVIGGPLLERVAELAAERVAVTVKADVRRAVTDQIGEEVAALVRQTLDEGVRRTDAWGQPSGEPTTVAGLVREETQRFLTAQTGDYNRRETNLQKMVREAVGARLSSELADAIKAAKTEVYEQVKAQAAEIVAKTITGLR